MSGEFENQKVSEILREIRAHRDKIEKFKLLEIVFIVALVFFLILSGACYVKYDYDKAFRYAIPFLISVVVALFFGRQGVLQREEIQKLLGQNFVSKIIAEEVQLIEYTPVFNISDDLIKMCTVLPGFNYSKANDYIRGRYKGVEFTCFDLHLRDGIEHSQHDTFKGQVIHLVLKKALGGTIVFKKKDNPRREVKRIDTVHNAFGALSGKMTETAIHVENEHLDNFFSIKTNNPEMASAVLTEERLNRISETIYQASGHTNVEINGKDVFITIDNNFDTFVVDKNIYDAYTLESACERYRSELKRILAIIDKMIADDELF